jgi:hypothetical protein
MELDEAARMHGASSFWKMILPLCRPIPTSAAQLQALSMPRRPRSCCFWSGQRQFLRGLTEAVGQ